MKKAKLKSEVPDMDDSWRAEDDLRTLMRAEEIKADPERIKKVHKHTKHHTKVIKSISDLKDTYNMKFGSEAKDGDE